MSSIKHLLLVNQAYFGVILKKMMLRVGWNKHQKCWHILDKYVGAGSWCLQIWDYDGRCRHLLHCEKAGDMVAEVGQVLSLKRSMIAVGWTKYV